MEGKCPYLNEKEDGKCYCELKEDYIDNETYQSCCLGEDLSDYMKCQDYVLFESQNSFAGDSMIFAVINDKSEK